MVPSTSTTPIADVMDLATLGSELLTCIYLRLEDVQDGTQLRATCRALKAVADAPGFSKLWCKAHPQEASARRELRRLKRMFAELDQRPIETAPSVEEHPAFPAILAKQRSPSIAAAHTPIPTLAENQSAVPKFKPLVGSREYYEYVDSLELETVGQPRCFA